MGLGLPIFSDCLKTLARCSVIVPQLVMSPPCYGELWNLISWVKKLVAIKPTAKLIWRLGLVHVACKAIPSRDDLPRLPGYL